TPQSEIEEILDTLKINHLFRKVIGAPTRKGVAIKLLLTEYLISIKETVMIGDSNSDCEAARVNNVPFILRRTNLNKILQEKVSCPMIDDFSNE
ncbi:MAG: HAD family hydrolase, partial [Candidatus Scalindua sp.]|nr:HAD family hydrolase [Candidatus Scalindua sp.]